MTPREKAVELYNHYDQLIRDNTRGVSVKQLAIECSIKTANEVIDFIDQQMQGWADTDMIRFWVETKIEIEKL